MTDTTQPHPEPQEATHKQPVSDEYNANLAAASLRQPSQEASRITDYLSSGGLFNPELANHDAVRELLIDCRTQLQEQALQHQRDMAAVEWCTAGAQQIIAERDEWHDRATEAQAERDAAREERDALKAAPVVDRIMELAETYAVVTEKKLVSEIVNAARSALRAALEARKT